MQDINEKFTKDKSQKNQSLEENPSIGDIKYKGSFHIDQEQKFHKWGKALLKSHF